MSDEAPVDVDEQNQEEEQQPPEPKNILKPEQIAAGLSQVSKIHGKLIHILVKNHLMYVTIAVLSLSLH